MVQGVGFRPFVYSLAVSLNLLGYVKNNPEGIEIFIEGTSQNINSFIKKLKTDLPSLAKIEQIKIQKQKIQEYKEFSILNSEENGQKSVLLPPDIAICDNCKKELLDQKNRRYMYPLINCTNCGPRYTIIKALPYDRKNTSMSIFKMCSDCQDEYTDYTNRRFHAEPISCPNCGPSLNIMEQNKNIIKTDEPIKLVAQMIKEGKIGAIKGLGGFHLVCDASNKKTINKLRIRKNRPKKPFAVMFKTLENIKSQCKLNKKEVDLLEGKNAPIVLLKKQKNFSLAQNLSFESAFLGAFLPYTPLQIVLFKHLNIPIVATSANISDEPIITEKEELFSKLDGIIDFVLDFDREIVNGCDDSVVRTFGQKEIFIRIARGYAPKNSRIKIKFRENVLALGAGQKSTISLGFGNSIITSAHIGDLFSIESVEKYKNTTQNLCKLYDFKPSLIICDKNGNYESSKYAKELGSPLLELQHHKAHFLAGLFENNMLESEALGIIFDGTGIGDDGTVWGGEFLLYNKKEIIRVNHIKEFWMLGGEISALEPRRSALSFLFDIHGEKALELKNSTTESFTTQELQILYKMYTNTANSIKTSSVGRLFDAVASFCGLTQKSAYEGESGLLMESLYDKTIKNRYDIKIDNTLDMSAIFHSNDSQKESVSKFLNTLSFAIGEIASAYNLPVILSGGVFQNAVLCNLVSKELKSRAIKAYFHKNLSPNDSNISVGQAVYANLVQNCDFI